MQVLMSFSACYCYCEYQKIGKQSCPETFQSSQKIINEDFHRFLTARRSMKALCADFVILYVIPHGMLLLTCNQEFQLMNEKAMVREIHQNTKLKSKHLDQLIPQQIGSALLNNKLITTYQVQGKTRSVRFQYKNKNCQIMSLQKQKKKNQERKYKFQNQLLNSFSHELRTPLNCSQQMLEAFQKLQNEEHNKELNQILYQNELLLCQINDILDYASIE